MTKGRRVACPAQDGDTLQDGFPPRGLQASAPPLCVPGVLPTVPRAGQGRGDTLLLCAFPCARYTHCVSCQVCSRGWTFTQRTESPHGSSPPAAPGFPALLVRSRCCGSCYTGVDSPSHSGHAACHTHEARREGVVDSNPAPWCFPFYFTDRLSLNTSHRGKGEGERQVYIFTELYLFSLRVLAVCDFTRLNIKIPGGHVCTCLASQTAE